MTATQMPRFLRTAAAAIGLGHPADRFRGAASSLAPVVIGGCGRSGTTLLDQILSSHGGIACLEESEHFSAALGEVIAASGRKVAIIAGADLAHVGPRFGDPAPVTEVQSQEIERADLAMLKTVESGDAEAFFDAVAADDDRRRICGYSPIYALLRSLGGAPGTVRRYGQWPDPQGLVSFASVVF